MLLAYVTWELPHRSFLCLPSISHVTFILIPNSSVTFAHFPPKSFSFHSQEKGYYCQENSLTIVTSMSACIINKFLGLGTMLVRLYFWFRTPLVPYSQPYQVADVPLSDMTSCHNMSQLSPDCFVVCFLIFSQFFYLLTWRIISYYS